MKRLLSLTALAASLLLTSCASSTPQGRIERNPQLFNALGSKDRELVTRGVIREGMTRDAVFLAWGAPDQTTVGRKGGRDVEQWTYLGQRPVRTMSMSMGFGYGWGGCGPYGYGGPWGGYGFGGPWGWGGPGWGSNVMYVPYTAGVVGFRGGRVTDWQAARR
ncbi:MAG: hypothetical protein JNG86_23450 [Verrucomicrobiaceae bacterium]|nr:hypothetical protein [Verrucomicrobiaceae bacterium]